MFRAFYKPADGEYDEVYQDAETLGELSPGAILVIQINEDGTRDLIQDESTVRALTAKEQTFYNFATRHLEYRHDGGDTPAMKLYNMEHR